MNQSRTHTCGELRLFDAGKKVTIVGWLENVREVGANFAFLVLRDFYGTTQVVVETADMMRVVKDINKESTISVTGTVRERESKNKKLPTGDIEVVPETIEVLGKCVHSHPPVILPFSKYFYKKYFSTGVLSNRVERSRGTAKKLHAQRRGAPDNIEL